MIASTLLQEIETHIPTVGDIGIKSPLAYQATRGAAEKAARGVVDTFLIGVRL